MRTTVLLTAAALLFGGYPVVARFGAGPGAIALIALSVLFAFAASGGVNALAAAHGALGAFAAGLVLARRLGLCRGAPRCGGVRRADIAREGQDRALRASRRRRARGDDRRRPDGLVRRSRSRGEGGRRRRGGGPRRHSFRRRSRRPRGALARLDWAIGRRAGAARAPRRRGSPPRRRRSSPRSPHRAHRPPHVARPPAPRRSPPPRSARADAARPSPPPAPPPTQTTTSSEILSPPTPSSRCWTGASPSTSPALARAYSAVDAARAAELGLDDAALRTVQGAGEALEHVSRAIMDVQG